MSSSTLKLWSHLFGELEGGYLVTFTGKQSGDPDARPNELDDTRQRSWSWPEEREKAAEYLQAESDRGRDAYVGVHLFRDRGNRRKDNAAEILALWVDGDGAEVPEDWPQPTAVVESSPGRHHFYWKLTHPISPEEASRLNQRLCYGMGGDKGKWGLGTVLRAPGTRNFKRETPTEVRELSGEIIDAWEPEVIDQAIPEFQRNSRNGHNSIGEPPVKLDERGLRVWRGEEPKLKDNGKIDRSATIVKVGRELYDAGAERPVIVAALQERDQGLGYHKYTGRPDELDRLHEIIDELEKNGRNRRIKRREEAIGIMNSDNTGESAAGFNLTDLGNASRLVARHGADLRYCYPWGAWLIWDGRRWAVDETGEIHRRAKQTVKGIYREASGAGDDETRKALAKHAMRSEAEARIQAMISLAKSEVPIMPQALDASPWLLNTNNGTVNLKTGELQDHRRENLITKIAPVKYDPAATASTWAATLERVIPQPAVRAFFKKLCGYAISGDVSEHILPVLYGTGANGKSTILNALLEAAGEYGMQAAPDLLIAKRGGHPTEVADLFGMRLVASIEVEDGRRLAEALIKSLTGGDKVRARRMRENFWQFDPTHTAFLCTNHKPEVRGTDTAIWRRIRLIPFTETIPPAEQDKKLPEKLRGELPGILAWAVEGCLAWQKEGLTAPDEVRKATGNYRAEMDVIGAFLRDECEIGKDHSAPFKEVFTRYEEWCEEAGEKPETRRKFNARLKERGPFTDRRSGPGGAYEWHGLQLLKKQNAGFAGKLKKHSQNDYNESNTPSRSVNSTNNFSSSVTSVEEDSGEWEGTY